MLIVMHKNATAAQVAAVLDRISRLGFEGHAMPGAQRVAIGITGNEGPIDAEEFRTLDGVVSTLSVSKPFQLVSREAKSDDTVLRVRSATIGGGHFAVMAGPCAVESREQILEVAHAVKEAGASVLRGGAYKPRTSPYAFQGLRDVALRYLAEAREATGLAVVTEVKDVETLPMVAEYADILQIGARNMQNFSLLEAVGQAHKPVLLKRGLSSTVEEWLMAAEYLAANGNSDVILCERGIRTFETVSRNTLDLGIIPFLRELTHLPVIVDPSHATGRWSAVPALARAAVAVGADGLMVEVHPDPSRALSDGPQSLKPSKFKAMMNDVRAVAAAVGVTLS